MGVAPGSVCDRLCCYIEWQKCLRLFCGVLAAVGVALASAPLAFAASSRVLVVGVAVLVGLTPSLASVTLVVGLLAAPGLVLSATLPLFGVADVGLAAPGVSLTWVTASRAG